MPRRPKNLQQSAWDAIDATYADVSSPEWMTTSLLPKGFWTDPHNHRRYIEWLGRELGIKQPDDWYQVLVTDFKMRRGARFLEYYGNSHIKAITSLYPKHNWEIWRFRQVPSGFWDDSRNIIAYTKWFEKQFGVAKKEDWYKVQQDDLFGLCGAGLLDRFGCSISRLVAFVYPEYDWLPWRFTQTEKHFWREKQNCLAYLRWGEQKLKLKSPEDWYRVKREDLACHHGGSLYVVSGFSRLELLRELHPEIEWHEWKFMQVSPGFWNSKSNRRRYLKWLEKQLGFSQLSDWYQVKNQDFHRLYGSTLVEQVFRRDIVAILKELYPKSKWLEWKFHQVPFGFWDDPKNCRRYLRWFAKRVGIKRKSDWYRISIDDFHANYGRGFIKRFKRTYGGLVFAYPNHKWLPWLFDRIPNGFWDDAENRERFLRWIGRQLKFKTADDWQRLTAESLRQMKGGNGLIMQLSVPQIRQEGASTFRS